MFGAHKRMRLIRLGGGKVQGEGVWRCSEGRRVEIVSACGEEG